MASQPTPEEAADALREVTERRQQAAGLDSHPKWALWVIAALAIVVGVSSDLRPDLSTPLTYLLAAGGLLLGYLPRWRRFGSAMGYRHSLDPRPVGMPARTKALNLGVLLGMMVLVVTASAMLRAWDMPYPTTIMSVLIVVAVMLRYRLLNRPSREPKVLGRG